MVNICDIHLRIGFAPKTPSMQTSVESQWAQWREVVQNMLRKTAPWDSARAELWIGAHDRPYHAAWVDLLMRPSTCRHVWTNRLDSSGD